MSLIKNSISWILLGCAAFLLRYKVVLQSDALFYDALASDLLVRGGAWADWKFSAAPGFVPDMILYFIGFLVFPDVSSRILFVSVVQAITFAALASMLAHAVSPRADHSIQAPVVLAVAFVTLVSAQSGMWLYFHTTNNHFGTVLFGLLATLLSVQLWKRPRSASALGLFAVVGCATVSSKLFVLNFTLPCMILAVCAYFLYGDNTAYARRCRSAAFLTGLVLVLGQVLAFALEAVLIHHQPIEGRSPLSRAVITHSLELFIAAGNAAFSADNTATFVLSLAAAGSLLHLSWKLLGWCRLGTRGLRLLSVREFPSQRTAVAVSLLCAASLVASCAGSILSGAIVDVAAYRYLAFPLSLAVLLTITQLDRLCRWRAYRLTEMLWLAGAILIAGNAIHLARRSAMPVNPAVAVAQCIVDAAATGFKPQAGIADYWNARGVTYRLPSHNPIVSTIHNLTPLFWVSTIGPFKDRERYREYHYNFAILRNSGTQVQFNYTPETVGRSLPPPSRVWPCADGATQLWLYDGPELDNTMQGAISSFMQHLKLIQ